MMRTIRLFLLFEAAAFAVAALVHGGTLVGGYEHRGARIAETVIAAVLFGGLLATWIWPAAVRGIGLTAQGFALFVTMIGVFMIAIGVGPRTVPDVIYHAAIVIVLVFGLVAARRPALLETARHA